MTQRKIEVFVGLALIAGVAGYSWYYHLSKDTSVVATLSDTVVNEISELSGLKVEQTEFTQTALADPYTHLAVNGEVWFTQTASGFDSSKTLVELPSIPEDAWYSTESLSKALDFSATWENIKSHVNSYFPESE
jgi:hypothetical protein